MLFTRVQYTGGGKLATDNSLEEDLGHMECVYLVCLGHGRLRGLDVSFGHGW